MTRITNWVRRRVVAIITFMVGILLIESIAMMLDEPHAIKPKSRLAKFFYISETARVPMMLGVMIILAPFTIANTIHSKLVKQIPH